MRHLLGAELKNFIRGADGPPKVVGRAGGILSIRGPEVARRALGFATGRVQTPTPRVWGLPSVDANQDRSPAVRRDLS